ncbi:hypothetical protein C7212DRAFT_359335 [Tuber magnatum]|uniref:DDE Tnp4 domain-containing protein n=1 Tax=Tuber magnatum TaxID=42249 RepID=A0A317SLL3_9PEZI|nr:hypothetical protein C7212DRAFT_359335 [Tuber magnatum]
MLRLPTSWGGSLFFYYSVTYTISQAVNWILAHVYSNWDFLLHDFSSPLASEHLSSVRLKLFAGKIHEKGALLTACWEFIDCTIREICRPTKWQRECCNGYRHMHAVKYSAVKAPDGLIDHLWGPFEESGLLSKCNEFASSYYLFGDPTYPVSSVLLSSFDNSTLTKEEKIFNKRMSSCREAVEWGFRIYHSPIGLQYRVATILTNIHVCLYGCETYFYFNCCPPSLENYLKKPDVNSTTKD